MNLQEYLESHAKRGHLIPEVHAATLKLWEAIRSAMPNLPEPDCGVSDSSSIMISWSHKSNETGWKKEEEMALETLEFDVIG